MKEDRRMKLQKKKFNSNHLLAIFIVVCGLLAGISVFAGGVLTPVKNIFFTVLSPMQEGINSVGNAVFSWNENAKSKKTLRAENERLQEKIDVLKMQNRVLQQNQVELERLQDLLKLKQKYKKYHTVGAQKFTNHVIAFCREQSHNVHRRMERQEQDKRDTGNRHHHFPTNR